jgi:hypothetical protein
MSRHDLLHTDTQFGTAETHNPIDAEIRTGLRRAFPLLAEGHDPEMRFHGLLAAFAGCHAAIRQPATVVVGVRL